MLKIYYKFKFICFLFIFFSFVKTKIEDINLDKGYYSNTYINQTGILKLKIKKIIDYSYLKIAVEGNEESESTNHIISYYQEEDLNIRNQLSQSVKDTTTMFLCYDQIQTKDFYITIECAKIPCDFNLYLNGTNMPEIYLNEQYTYYVTKENKNMNFKLIDYSLDLDPNKGYFISIWARGNYKIKSELTGGEYEKLSSYNYYRINYDNFINSTYILSIEGEIGDLINIGIILFEEAEDGISISELTLENGEEITGYLNPREGTYFSTINQSNLSLGYYYDFNNKIINPNLFLLEYYGIKSKDDDLFYSLQYLKDTKYDGQGNNKYSPLLNGIYYLKQIEEGTIIDLIPMKPEDNFNLLTYAVFPIDGNISVSIYKCENYPLCHINETIFETSEKVEDFESFYYSYNYVEWENEISPISKKQNMLLIKCNKGITSQDGRNICRANIIMKTDLKIINNTDFNNIYYPYRRFIRKNTEDKFFYEGKSNSKYTYKELYIELFSGNISIITDPYYNFKYGIDNNKLYYIPHYKDINVTITAIENSIYSIYVNYDINKDILKIDSNYFYNLEEEPNEKSKIFNPKDQSEFLDILNKNSYDYYITFYPLLCSVYSRIEKDEKYDYNSIASGDIYQDIISTSLKYKLEISKGISDYYGIFLFYISSFKKENISSYNMGIPLQNNSYQKLLVNKDNKEMIFIIPHTEIKNGIKIDILTKEKCNLKFMVNGEIFKNKNIKSKTNFKIYADEIKKICMDFKFICKIILFVKMDEKVKESYFSVKFISNNYGSKKDNNNNKLIIILSILAAFIFVVICIVIFLFFRNAKKKAELKTDNKKVPFKDDRELDTKENCETPENPETPETPDTPS